MVAKMFLIITGCCFRCLNKHSKPPTANKIQTDAVINILLLFFFMIVYLQSETTSILAGWLSAVFLLLYSKVCYWLGCLYCFAILRSSPVVNHLSSIQTMSWLASRDSSPPPLPHLFSNPVLWISLLSPHTISSPSTSILYICVSFFFPWYLFR